MLEIRIELFVQNSPRMAQCAGGLVLLPLCFVFLPTWRLFRHRARRELNRLDGIQKVHTEGEAQLAWPLNFRILHEKLPGKSSRFTMLAYKSIPKTYFCDYDPKRS